MSPDHQSTAVAPDAVQPPPPPKKAGRRRPLWLLVKLTEEAESPYAVYKCIGVEAVRQLLLKHNIDASTIEKRTIIFRADPVAVKIKTQLLIQF